LSSNCFKVSTFVLMGLISVLS